MKSAGNRRPSFWRNNWVIVNLCLLLLVLCHSAWRDLHIEEEYYAVDLRNRIVGSRLQKDGILPYFFHWENKGGARYADPLSRGNTGGNAITASPFFHELLMPVCDLSERQLQRGWLLCSWLLLLAMTVMVMRLAQNSLSRLMLINLGSLFTLTEGWKMHIYTGQLYLFVAFLMTGFVFFIQRGKKLHWLPGGLFAAALVLCRPIALVIGLPLLPGLKKYRLHLFAGLLFLTAYGIFVYTSPLERAIWTDYGKALSAHVAFHQSGLNFDRTPRPDRPITTIEGIDLTGKGEMFKANGSLFRSENGNVFVIYNSIFHRRMSLAVLNGILLLVLLVAGFIWCYRFRYASPPPWQAAVLGWTFYMIVEIFSPIHRHQYNVVEWLPAVLTLTAFIDWRQRTVTGMLLIAGLLLNIFNFPWLLMRHTIGECCWIAAGLSVLFFQSSKPVSWKQPL